MKKHETEYILKQNTGNAMLLKRADLNEVYVTTYTDQ